jgi:hypothetical protein
VDIKLQYWPPAALPARIYEIKARFLRHGRLRHVFF